jgi:polysaccharide export outer membrane protein
MSEVRWSEGALMGFLRGRLFPAVRRVWEVRFWAAAWCGIAVAMCCFSAFAQTQNSNAAASSPLARDNMSQVAASAAEVKAVLLKDAGLMVELKRWVAKDATDHGQVIAETDLTNDAIFDRLETDVQFRSVATLLLQKYGYLVPQLNPNSEAAHDHELLVKERIKRLEETQPEELTKQRRNGAQNLQNAEDCDPQFEGDCNASQNPRSQSQRPGQAAPPETPPSGNYPGNLNPNQNSPSLPSGNGNPLELAQFIQSEGQYADPNSSLVPGWGNASTQSTDGLGGLASQAGASRMDGQTGGFPQANSANRSAADGGGTFRLPQDDLSALPIGASQTTRLDVNPSGVNSPSRMVPTERAIPGRKNETLVSPVEMVHTPNPYNDIPSLYDMYMQAAPHPATPRRFGAEVFENGTRDSQLFPMDLPAGPDYVVGPGDGLSIELWGGVSQRLYRTVDREGRVSLPEVGPLLVSGKSLAEVQESLQQTLRTQFRDVSADVSLGRLRTIRVYEVGDISSPGAYDISSLSTPLNALFAAGGPTTRGSLRVVKHYRGNQLVQTVDLYDLLLHGVRSDIQRLENGDTVLVPPIGPQVTVEGMIRRPAVYELRDEKNLAEVLELAGGLLPTAAVGHIEVQRLVAHEKRTMLSLDIPEGGGEAEITQKFVTFSIQDGDRIRIFPIAQYNQDVIYLDGHVLRPGRYSYHKDMRVTDVIGTYKDLLPEPATHYAEIIRINAPDFRPSVESFDLAGALADPSQAPMLQPMDTLRIFSRYDFENPAAVSVVGDVRGPGTYRTSGQIHLTDALHLAGGISPDAETDDAQVFRYLPGGKLKIFSVNLGQALAGDPAENILMQPRDRLLIHRSPAALQPETVYLEGEVGKPGRYPLTTNMTAADLIRSGGGLKPSAETQSADLTHYDWTNQAQLSARREAVSISAALAGDSNSNVSLHNGDVLTIRQLSGWNDLGASITLKGELQHPGTYGIRPGEKLSSVLERAGGFQPGSYPYGAVLQRVQVRELESKQQDEMILRVKDLQDNIELLPDSDPRQKQAKEMALQQYQATLTELSANAPAGRVAIRISPDIDRWRNTSADIEVRAGDMLVVPKKPSHVMVMGQVFNPTAVSYRPGRSAKWYLSQSGGPTQLANKKAIFVIRADGSVIGTSESLWGGNSLEATLQPGDTVVVPEKAVGGGIQWQTVFLAAQVASSVASAVIIAVRY